MNGEVKMSFKVRRFFVGLVVACMLFAPVLGQAEGWAPKGSITLQVAFGAGGSTDMITRLLAANIEKTTGWNIVVENKPGGGGVAMLSGLMHKKPDGQILGVAVNMPIVINLALRGDKLPFKISSFDYIGTMANIELGLCSKADAPFNDFAGFLEHAKKTGAIIGFDAKPQQLVYTAIGKKTGVKMKLVSHKSGAEQIQGLLGGHIMAACLAGEQIKYIKSGDLKLIASMSKKRHGYAPDVKTLIESGYDYYLDPYFYIAAPKGLPANVKATLTKVVNNSLQSAEVKEAINNVLKVDPLNLGPEGTQKMMEEGMVDIAYLLKAGKQ
jgi:tripartite-type tricarboxylate transporter receptor subunit TctC